MKKRQKNKLPTEPVIKNPVAKYAHHVNKAHRFADKTKYQRNAKHKTQESFRMSFFEGIAKGCLLFFVGAENILTV